MRGKSHSLVEFRAQCLQCVGLSLLKSNLTKVCKWCCRLSDAFTKISNCVFKRKLSDVGTRSNAGDFRTDME